MSDEIRDLQVKLLDMREEAEDLEEVLKDLKSSHMVDLQANEKELGLTNEMKRKLALETRLSTDENYSRLKGELRDMRHTIALLEIDEQFERRKMMRWFADRLCGVQDADMFTGCVQ